MNEEIFGSCLVVGAGGQIGQLFLENISSRVRDIKLEAVERQEQKGILTHRFKDSATISTDLKESLKKNFDVVIVAVPLVATGVFDVIAENINRNATLIFPQNGVAIVPIILRLFNKKNVNLIRSSLFTSVSLNKEREAVYNHDKLRISFAPINEVPKEIMEKAKVLFASSGFKVKLFDDYKSMEWTKLITNGIGSTAAITGFTPRETFNDKKLFALETEALKTRLTIMNEAGISFVNIPWQNISLIPLIKNLPVSLLSAGQSLIAELIVKGRRNEQPAAARKIAKGQPTEIKYYHQPFIELGRLFGLRSHVDEAICEIISEHERGNIDLATLTREEKRNMLLETYQKQLERPLISRNPLMTSIVSGLIDFFVKKIDFSGKENADEVRRSLARGKSVIFIANHLSHSDHAVLVKALKINGFADIAERLIFVAGMLFKNEFIAKYLSDAYARIIISTPSSLPVSEEENRKAQLVNLRGFREANRLLNQGNILVIYAEGTRSRKGALQKAIAAVALYFENENVEYVVPIAIQGTAEILPVGKTVPQFGNARINFGKPIRPAALIKEALKGLAENEKSGYRRDKKIRDGVYQKEVDWVMRKIAGFLPEDRKGYYV